MSIVSVRDVSPELTAFLVSRPKRGGVPGAHVGVVFSDGVAFHNAPGTGCGFEPSHAFALPNERVRVLAHQVGVQARSTRVRALLQVPCRYDAFANNCEDAAYTAFAGRAGSPQRTRWLAIGIAVTGIAVLTGRNGAKGTARGPRRRGPARRR